MATQDNLPHDLTPRQTGSNRAIGQFLSTSSMAENLRSQLD